MKAPVLYGAIALCVIACSRPDSALFGPDAPEGSAGDSGRGGTSPTTGGAETSGGSLAQGGTNAEPNAGTDAGGTSVGGTQPSGGNGGEPGEVPGGAGESAGGSNTPDPPMPVCGNGIIETGEECDDAGQTGMDGCEKCQVNCMHFGAGTLKSDDHHCYRGYDEATFEGAVQACKERGAHLVTITSAAENEVVSDLVNSSKFIGGWEDLGLMVEGQGNYGWVTGEALSYTNWAQGEPDLDDFSCGGWGNERCYEHCLIMNGQGTWEDHRCDQPDGYACEWEPAGTVK